MLDALESGSFKLIVKNRATVDAHGCVISICKLRLLFIAIVVTDSVYLHIGVGFGVARSTIRAMPEPQCVGRVTGKTPTLFVYIRKHHYQPSKRGSRLEIKQEYL